MKDRILDFIIKNIAFLILLFVVVMTVLIIIVFNNAENNKIMEAIGYFLIFFFVSAINFSAFFIFAKPLILGIALSILVTLIGIGSVFLFNYLTNSHGFVPILFVISMLTGKLLQRAFGIKNNLDYED